LSQWCINTNIMFLDVIHRPPSCFYLKTPCFGDWILSLFQIKPAKLDTIDGASQEAGTSSIDWAQQSRFYLKTETESSLRNVLF
jgi:hypothetical protein